MLSTAHKGTTAFLLRKSAVLKKARAVPKKFEADFSVIDRPNDYYDEEPIGFIWRDSKKPPTGMKRDAREYKDTVDMKDVEEEKES